jgi:hypothetical protein
MRSPRFVAAHGDDPLSSHFLGREDAHKPDRAVADDHHGRTFANVGGVGGVPARSQHV